MSQCPRCHVEFSCGMVEGPADVPCWCACLPQLPAAVLATGKTCFCPDCLKALLAEAALAPPSPS